MCLFSLDQYSDYEGVGACLSVCLLARAKGETFIFFSQVDHVGHEESRGSGELGRGRRHWKQTSQGRISCTGVFSSIFLIHTTLCICLKLSSRMLCLILQLACVKSILSLYVCSKKVTVFKYHFRSSEWRRNRKAEIWLPLWDEWAEVRHLSFKELATVH